MDIQTILISLCLISPGQLTRTSNNQRTNSTPNFPWSQLKRKQKLRQKTIWSTASYIYYLVLIRNIPLISSEPVENSKKKKKREQIIVQSATSKPHKIKVSFFSLLLNQNVNERKKNTDWKRGKKKEILDIPSWQIVDKAEDHREITAAVGGEAGAHVGGHGVGHVAQDGKRSGTLFLQLGQDGWGNGEDFFAPDGHAVAWDSERWSRNTERSDGRWARGGRHSRWRGRSGILERELELKRRERALSVVDDSLTTTTLFSVQFVFILFLFFLRWVNFTYAPEVFFDGKTPSKNNKWNRLFLCAFHRCSKS